MVQQKLATPKRLPLISTALLVVLTVLTFTVWNPPQCPDDYTQAQVDASNCIIGANIGAGMIFMFVILPLAVFVCLYWMAAIIVRLRKPPKGKGPITTNVAPVASPEAPGQALTPTPSDTHPKE